MKLDDYNLWTALVTPLTPGLSVDFDSLGHLIKEQCEAKNGLLILGSTGEALNLSLSMRKAIVEYTIAQKPSSPIMIGVGGHALHEQIEWIEWLETKNIDAYLMVTPIYAKPGTFGQYEWFKNLMDRVSRPVMIYNVPGRAAMELSYQAITMLKDHKNYWSIKEASGSVEKMKKYLLASGNKKVFCGDDALLPSFTEAGACGLISVASNTWPKETNLYVRKSLDGSLLESATLWKEASASLFIASNPIPAKAILVSEGRISHDTMMPPLSRRDLIDTAKLTQYSEKIKTWYKNNQ